MAIQWANASVSVLTALANGGTLKLYTGTLPALNNAPAGTLLVTLTFGSTAFGAPSAGVATSNAITSGTAVATGTAAVFAIYKSDGTTLVATGTVATSGGDLTIDNASISSGATISAASGALTVTG